MKVLTLTLNPAIDVHCYSENFTPFSENFFDITSNDASGKGVNISRVLTNSGIENKAIIVAGSENGEEFLKRLAEENINYSAVFVPGKIRENITLHAKDVKETRISFSGFLIDETVIDKVCALLEKENLKDAIVTFTGSVPDGVDISYVKKFLLYIKEKGVKIVLDCRSFKKDDIIEVGPWLIKPNEEEIKMYSDIPVTDKKSAIEAARKLKEQGIENAMISLGGDGAVLCCDEGVFFAKSPKIDVVSTIGAGDSAISGFITATVLGKDKKDALKTAVAYGSAACLADGTKPPKKDDIERIFKEIVTEK